MKQPATHSDAQLKRALRSVMRSRRRALDCRERARASAGAASFATALPLWAPGARIAAYMAGDGEIDPAPLLQGAARDGLQIALPTINEDRTLSFRHWSHGQALVNNRFGIAEPAPGAAECAIAQIDILILPLVAWDRYGGRLGMGGGFYDRTLHECSAQQSTLNQRMGQSGEGQPRRLPAYLCGLAYSWQEVEQLPREPWDVQLDMVLTERGLLQLGGDTVEAVAAEGTEGSSITAKP